MIQKKGKKKIRSYLARQIRHLLKNLTNKKWNIFLISFLFMWNILVDIIISW